jgi:hypothetical protein
VGIVASKHLTLVLSRLDALVKSELTRKSSRLLGLLRDTRQEMEIEKARLTLLYSYAYVVKEAPPSELAPQLANLCQFFISQLTICKVNLFLLVMIEFCVRPKTCCLETQS